MFAFLIIRRMIVENKKMILYLHLELLPPGIVNEEWKTVLPQRLSGLVSNLYGQTGHSSS